MSDKPFGGIFGKYTVWQWGIEIGLGSCMQSKLSSRIIKAGEFNSHAEAEEWAAKQDKSDWGYWMPVRCGKHKVVECWSSEIPEAYTED